MILLCQKSLKFSFAGGLLTAKGAKNSKKQAEPLSVLSLRTLCFLFAHFAVYELFRLAISFSLRPLRSDPAKQVSIKGTNAQS